MKVLNFNPELLEKARRIAAEFGAKLRDPCAERRAPGSDWRGTGVRGSASGVVAAEGGVSEMYLYDAIGGWWAGITADWMRRELDAMKGTTKRLNIFVNSPGGDVFEAKAILSLLQRFPAEKVLYVDGLIASAATFIAMGADRIVTAPHATWMIHEAWGWAGGNAKAMREYAELLEMVSGDIAGIYASRTKQPLDELLKLMAAETWMTADEAKDLGFTDSVATFDQDNAAPAREPEEKEAAAAMAQSVLAATRARLDVFRAEQSKRQRTKREHTT